GEQISDFVPALLGEGTHELQYINSAFGCTDTTVSIIQIMGQAEFSIPALNEPICAEAAPFVLTGEPFGGYVTIDGVRDSLLNPAALGIGPHMAAYYFNGVLDSIAFIDQASGLGSYISGAQGAVDIGDTLWQSFTPAFSGRLENITISLYGPGGPFSYGVTLYRGQGINGAVIATDTITTGDAYPNVLGDMHPQVLRDSTYTFSVERLPDGIPGTATTYYFNDGTLYGRGTGQYRSSTSVDLFFQETVSHTYTCADSISVPFTVEVCTGMQELGANEVILGPNPFNDVLTLRSSADVRYVLYNAVGAELLTGMARGHALTNLSTEQLAAGLYTLRYTALDGTGARALKVVKGE
ncbi:MAG TPA: hypothetical protein PK760_05975, partial [Flavobacteriales bacterium]|nr:hypothetical protein [Flavobacteriales bacterium]